MNNKEEVNEFIDSMIHKGILKDYLTENRDTIRNMIEKELKAQQYLEFFEKQNIEEGEELGRKEASKKVIQNLLNLEMSQSQIAQVVELPEDEVVSIIEELQSIDLR